MKHNKKQKEQKRKGEKEIKTNPQTHYKKTMKTSIKEERKEKGKNLE
jgi:hypothetical protein